MGKNPYKQLEPQLEVPEEIKEKVMQDVEDLKLLMDMGALFSMNYVSVLESFFKSKNK